MNLNRYLIFIVLSGFLAESGFAQEDTTLRRSWAKEDSTLFEPPGSRRQRITVLKDQILGKNYWEEKFRGNWAGIFVGVNGLARTDYSLYPEGEQNFFDPDLLRSYAININLLQFSQGLQRSRNTIGLITGVGIDLRSWHLDKRSSISKGQVYVEPVELNYDEPRKSKVVSGYLSIPLLIEFQVPVKEYGNRLYVSTGVILNKRLSTHTKIKYTHQGKDYKLKSHDDYYMRDYHYSATFRIGYRWINLFASYDLQPLFNGEKGPEVFPYSAGIGLISF